MHLDWSTLALQTINVVVLIWLLARYLFRPVTAMIAERRAMAEQLLADAAASRAGAETDAAAAQQRLHDLAAEGDRIMAEARAAAGLEKAKLLREAEEAAVRSRAEARVAIGNERIATERVLRRQASDLAVTVARRLVRRLPAEAATMTLLDTVVAAVAGLPEEQRRDLSSCEGPVDVITAVPLDADAQAQCRASLETVMGHAANLVFRTEPALIAGVELRADRLVIRNNWQADLERIAVELDRDEPNAA
jgi:F-type H+-transporting ATPase subunit b